MASPTCIKCNGSSFTTTVQPAAAAGRDVVLIHCSACGVVVAAVEQAGVWNMVREIAKKLGVTT